MPPLSSSRAALLVAALVFPVFAGPASAAPEPLRGVDVAKTWVTGDVNGDGIADLGARPGAGLGVTYGTATTDVRTGPTGPGLDLQPATGETLGRISDAGDFDGDGKDDLLVTAQRGGSALAYVVHGAAGSGTVTVAAGGARVTAIGLAVPFQFGVDPRFAGDVNGDGKDDVIVGRQTGTNVGASGWTGGFAVVHGGAAGATLNANAGGSRVLVLNSVRTCSWIFTSYVCGVQSLEVSPIGDVSADGRADLFIDGGSAARRFILPGRTATGTLTTSSVPPGAVRAPVFFPLGRTFAGPAGDVNGDGLGDFSVLSKVADSPQTPQQRLVILGTRATSGTAQAGPALVSQGEVGAAELVDDQTGDGRPDLVVLTRTADHAIDDDDPSTWDERLFRIQARIASIPAGATAATTVDLDAAPAVPGVPQAGYGQYGDSVFGLRAANVDSDARLELGLSLGGRLLLVDSSGTDRLAPELFDVDGSKGVSLPSEAIDPIAGAPRGLRVREAATLRLEYRRADGTLVGSEERALPAGTTRDRWLGTVNGATLPAGTYTLSATPRDAAGNRGATQTRELVVVAGNPAATIDVVPWFTNPDESLITPGSGSYRLDCASPNAGNGTWVAAQNGKATKIDTSGMPTPPQAGTQCALRFDTFAGDKAPAECAERPTRISVNNVDVTPTTWPITFTLKPGANFVAHERGCTAPTGDGSRPIPGLASTDWVGSGPAGSSLLLTGGANRIGGKLFPFPVDPNRRTYEFKVTFAGGNGQAEGVALSFLRPKPGAANGGFPGTGGGALGVGGLDGTIVAIDQFKGAGDTRSSGVGIADGASTAGLNWLATADPGQLLRGKGAVPIKVVANGTTVAIYVSGKLRLERTMTLPSPAFVAVSGSTGTTWQNQTISDLTVTP